MPYNYKTELERYRRYYRSLEPILRQPKAQTYTMVIFSFLTVSLFGLYAIRPTVNTILYLKREIRDKTEVSKKMDDKIAALIEAQSNYEAVTPYLPVVDESLPNNPDAIPLLVQFQNLSAQSGAELTSVQMSGVPLSSKEATASANKTADAQKTFDFSVSVRGSYQSLNVFLEGLKQLRRIVSYEALSVEPVHTSQSGTDSAQLTSRQLQLTIKVIAYYVPQL